MSNLLDLIDQTNAELDFQYSPPFGGVFVVNKIMAHADTHERVRDVLLRKHTHWHHGRLGYSQYSDILLHHTSSNVRNILATIFLDNNLRRYFRENTDAIYDVLKYFRSKKTLGFIGNLSENWIYIFILYLRLYFPFRYAGSIR